MRVKKLISFYENQHYFTILFAHNFLSRWLNESFRFFCISYIKILENWFILVHFTKSLFLFFFVAYRAAQYFGVGIIYFIIYVICGGFVCPSDFIAWQRVHSHRHAGIPQAAHLAIHYIMWQDPLSRIRDPVPPHHQLPQADNWWENQRWQIHQIQLPLNEQRETTSLWSFPFVRCIHSDYITWLSKRLCMHIQWLDIIIRFMYPIAHIIR